MGLCLVAVSAMFALTATSSLGANLPVYGKCVSKSGGKFLNSGCTKAAKPGKELFEWEPLAAVVPFKSKSETGTLIDLEGESGVVISCKTQVQKSGEYGPGNQVKNTVGQFNGCETSGIGCSSEKAAAGEINTKKLHGEPGVVTKNLKEEKNVVGNDLRGEESESLAEFSCSTIAVAVTGGVVVKAEADGLATTNKMTNKVEVEFVTTPKGKEVPTKWTPNGGGISNSKNEEIFESLITHSGGKEEFSGQTLTTVQETTGTKPKVELRMCEAALKC